MKCKMNSLTSNLCHNVNPIKNSNIGWLPAASCVTQAEPILPIRRICKLRRAPKTPGGPFALKDVLILVLFLILASSSENMNDRFF